MADQGPPCPTCGVSVNAISAGLSDEEMLRRGYDPSVRIGPGTQIAEPCGHPVAYLADASGTRTLSAAPLPDPAALYPA